MLPGVRVEEVGTALRIGALLDAWRGTGMTMTGGIGLGVGVGAPSAASIAKESPSSPRSDAGGLTSKLTEDEEEGFGFDTERRALGGREVAGTGRRWALEVDGGLEASVEEEYE
jgi:hypothetical protein